MLPLHNDRFWSAVWMLLFMAGIDVDPGATVAVSGVGGGVGAGIGGCAEARRSWVSPTYHHGTWG